MPNCIFFLYSVPTLNEEEKEERGLSKLHLDTLPKAWKHVLSSGNKAVTVFYQHRRNVHSNFQQYCLVCPLAPYFWATESSLTITAYFFLTNVKAI